MASPKVKVEPRKVEPSYRPTDNEGAFKVAAGVIRKLDHKYSREEVHAIAQWVLYLSTQS